MEGETVSINVRPDLRRSSKAKVIDSLAILQEDKTFRNQSAGLEILATTMIQLTWVVMCLYGQA